MRRKFSAILILSVFFCLQYGKVATYLYCKWQAEIIQNKPDCGCDDHLTSMFDHDDDSTKGDISKNNLNEKLNEFTPRSFIISPLPTTSPGKFFTEYKSSLSESYIDSPFHPPIA